MKAEEFIEIVSEQSKVDYGLMPPPISAEKGLNVLIEHFLGKDWYTTSPLSQEQVYTEAIYQILEKNPNKK
jgi:hypothetical protein